MINKDPLLFIPADKSNNLYKVSKDTYIKLLQDNITKSYKTSNVTLINNIYKEVKAIVAELNPLSTNPTKWSKTLKQFVGKLPTNCLSVFDHFVILALKGLNSTIE